eukprot:CAMPEP_0180182000 /NCGR_PEP_ID=MMETSP0986-20121125/40422_1 /TAXON_ID=697907 /ORGANISM="non described non described, Strain CCMP2293" /LENGTH=168 /DNA_ID=CAMNT_0022135319 /DNA_START=184 /DNA_END=691 /DNA_ORIENTATION=-
MAQTPGHHLSNLPGLVEPLPLQPPPPRPLGASCWIPLRVSHPTPPEDRIPNVDGAEERSSRQVPPLAGAVVAARGELAPVNRERCCEDMRLVASHAQQQCSRLRIDQIHVAGPGNTRSSDGASVGRKPRKCSPRNAPDLLAAFDVPHMNLGAGSPAHESRIVGRRKVD